MCDGGRAQVRQRTSEAKGQHRRGTADVREVRHSSNGFSLTASMSSSEMWLSEQSSHIRRARYLRRATSCTRNLSTQSPLMPPSSVQKLERVDARFEGFVLVGVEVIRIIVIGHHRSS